MCLEILQLTCLLLPPWCLFFSFMWQFQNMYIKLSTWTCLSIPFSSTWASLPQASLFTRLTTANQKALTCTSVGTVFVTFCTIVLYHTVIRITEFFQKYYYFQQIATRMNGLKQRINGHRQNQNQETHQPGHTTRPPVNPQVLITSIELCEPLLEYYN